MAVHEPLLLAPNLTDLCNQQNTVEMTVYVSDTGSYKTWGSCFDLFWITFSEGSKLPCYKAMKQPYGKVHMARTKAPPTPDLATLSDGGHLS